MNPPRVRYYGWLPLFALALLWPLSDTATNRALFLALNGLAAPMPAALWSNLTVLGDGLVALCLLLPFIRRRPDLVLAAVLASLPAALITFGLKDAMAVMRPFATLGDQAHVIGPYLTAGSFPSGHTATIFLLASVLTIGLGRRRIAVVLIALALLIGLSRIAVGAHWPMDIAGGAACGWLSGMIGLHLARRFDSASQTAAIAVIRVVLVVCALALLLGYDSRYPLARPFEQSLALMVLVFHLLPGWSLRRQIEAKT